MMGPYLYFTFLFHYIELNQLFNYYCMMCNMVVVEKWTSKLY